MTGLSCVSITGCHASLELLERLSYSREEVVRQLASLRASSHARASRRAAARTGSPAGEPDTTRPEKPNLEPPEIDLHARKEEQERQPHECQKLDREVGFHPTPSERAEPGPEQDLVCLRNISIFRIGEPES
jgi:hypothetical protein